MPEFKTIPVLFGLASPAILKKGEIRIVQMLVGGLILGNLIAIWRGEPEAAEIFNKTYLPVLMAVLGYFFGKEESEV